jgi:hypothetical protein
MSNLPRRQFLIGSSSLLVSAAVGGSVAHADTPAFYPMAADVTGRCGTCRYWGGMRKLSEDGETVLIQSMGWCNNPKSVNYQKLTTAESGPMPAWKRWELIE